MLKKCKVTKFWEVNYKIFARILATPVVIAAVLGDASRMYGGFYGKKAGLEHILLHCLETKKLHDFILTHFEESWSEQSWIFGLPNKYLNPLVWISNFSTYKCHLQMCHSIYVPLLTLFQNECLVFAPIFPVVKDFLDHPVTFLFQNGVDQCAPCAECLSEAVT